MCQMTGALTLGRPSGRHAGSGHPVVHGAWCSRSLTQIQGLDCPDEALALGYAVRHLRRVADSTIWFESNRRTAAQETEPDRELTRDKIREGVELAETGLALDASEWPTY